MKFKYLFSAIAASLVLLSGCTKDESLGSLDNIKLSETFLTIDAKGGTAELTIDATEDWTFQTISKTWPEVVSEVDGQKVTTPSWLSVDKMSGAAGQTKVTFTAGSSDTGRELSLSIKVGTNMQYLKVRQGSLDPVDLTCKDIEEGKVTVGANYKMKGTVTQLGNYASYGAFYINDGTSTTTAQVYSSTDESKAAYPTLEVGDYVEFSGTWSSYKNFENVEISELKKCLIKIDDNKATVTKAGGEIAVKVAYKGSGVFLAVPEDCDWIEYVGMEYKNGTHTKLDQSPADTAIVTFSVAANEGNSRECEIKFSSYQTEKIDGEWEVSSSDATFMITQEMGLNVAPLPFEETFKSGQGSFTINNVILPTGSTYVWSYDKYGYMKASSYVNKTNLVSEAWLISPYIDLAAENPTLSFSHALNYINNDKPEDHISVWVRTLDGEWSELTGYTYPTGKSWSFVESGSIDLKAYAGTTFQFAFKYVGSTTAAPTWEVKNVKVK